MTKSRTTNGLIMSTLISMGMKPWEAMGQVGHAICQLKRDADETPMYLTDRQGRRWFVDGSGDVA